MQNNTLVRKWITGSIMLTALLILTPWIVGWRMEAVSQKIAQEMSTPLAKTSIDKELKLSEDQKSKLAVLESHYADEMSKCCERHCSARMKMGTLLVENPHDLKFLAELSKEVGDAYVHAEQATAQHVVQVCELLNQEQRAIFLKKISKNISATCPAPFAK